MALSEDRFDGHLFPFRGRRSAMIKVLWWSAMDCVY
ncbi:hypothetical protein [Duganella sp. OV458]